MDIRKAAARFLFSEKTEQWSFNYWTRRRAESAEVPYPPYPDDLDDTFAAIAALARHDSAAIDGHALSAIARMLTYREVQAGGPYRTWLVTDAVPRAWQDVDLVVNSTIGHSLSLIGVHLPNLERFISDAVRYDRLASPYYPGIFHVGYFLSRFYKNNAAEGNADVRAKLADIITSRFQKDDRTTITTLEHSMAISALIDLGCADRVASMVTLLADRVESEGFLPYAFCIDPARDGERCYAGASALTAAFCAEALARYSALAGTIAHDGHTLPTIHDHIRSIARTACRSIGQELRDSAITQIKKTTDERITALAYEFRDILYRSGRIVPPDVTEQLSLANLYGWMAYEIYDDALDGEDGAALIPCANFFLRSLTDVYQTLAARAPEIAPLFTNTMNCVDNANAWEQKYCRVDVGSTFPRKLPDFGDYCTLADRSIGHAMGPLAALLLAGYAADSEEYKNCESFFRHYLIARQLHDDAHDWTDDLLHGRVNSVGALVLHRFKERYLVDPPALSPTIAAILPRLRKIFWEEIIDETTGAITSHITEARRTRQRSSLLDQIDFLESELRKLQFGARRAVKERNEVLVFLGDYMA